MAEHRRVEPRGIVGTGMAADPEKIREVEHEYDRRARAWRPTPEKGFGDVLAEAPARGALEDAGEGDPRRQKKRPDGAPPEPSMSAEALRDAPAADATKDKPEKQDKPKDAARSSRPVPRLPPDPRERLLRGELERRMRAPAPPSTMDTPPTGKTRKPT
jgi:hypothetical protein